VIRGGEDSDDCTRGLAAAWLALKVIERAREGA
jgi:hypothetical protein